MANQEFCLSLHRPRIGGNAEVQPFERRTNGFKQNLARVVVGKPRHSSFVSQGTILLIIMPQKDRSVNLNWHYIKENKSSCHPFFVNSPHNKKNQKHESQVHFYSCDWSNNTSNHGLYGLVWHQSERPARSEVFPLANL